MKDDEGTKKLRRETLNVASPRRYVGPDPMTTKKTPPTPAKADSSSVEDSAALHSSQKKQVVLSPPPLPRGHRARYTGVPSAKARPLEDTALEDVRRELFYKLDTLAPQVSLEKDVEYGGLPRFRLLREGEYTLDASLRQVGESRVLDVETLAFGEGVTPKVREDILDALIRAASSLNRHPNLEATDIRVRTVSPGTEPLWEGRGVDLQIRQTDQATLRPYYGRLPDRLSEAMATIDLGNR